MVGMVVGQAVHERLARLRRDVKIELAGLAQAGEGGCRDHLPAPGQRQLECLGGDGTALVVVPVGRPVGSAWPSAWPSDDNRQSKQSFCLPSVIVS